MVSSDHQGHGSVNLLRQHWCLVSIDIQTSYSIFHSHTSASHILLVVYVDDRDHQSWFRRHCLIQHLQQMFIQRIWANFNILWLLKLLDLGINLFQSICAWFVRQTRLLDACPVETSMDLNEKLLEDEGDIFEDPSRNHRLLGKFNYLTITRPNI